MKSYFRILSALSAVATVIAFSGCGGKEQEQPKPDSVKVSGVSIDKPRFMGKSMCLGIYFL